MVLSYDAVTPRIVLLTLPDDEDPTEFESAGGPAASGTVATTFTENRFGGVKVLPDSWTFAEDVLSAFAMSAYEWEADGEP